LSSDIKKKLDPNVKNSKFTEEEDTLIIKLHEEYGSKWFEISRQFKNRNAKMIKKRFQSYLKYKCPKLKKCNRLNKLTESNNQNSSQNSRIDQGKENLTRKTTMMVNEHPQLQTAKKNTIIPTIILDNSFNKSNGNSHNRHSNYINLKDDTFNVDMFFENQSNNNYPFEKESANKRKASDYHFNINNFPKINETQSFSKQVQMLDDYLIQVLVFFNSKTNEFETLKMNNPLQGNDIETLLNLIAQVDNNANIIINQINLLKGETTAPNNESFQNYLVRYIEMIIQLIHQIKTKLNFCQAFQEIVNKKQQSNADYSIFN